VTTYIVRFVLLNGGLVHRTGVTALDFLSPLPIDDPRQYIWATSQVIEALRVHPLLDIPADIDMFVTSIVEAV
jgi:hypothetical protein